jgi:hypothetical protein
VSSIARLALVGCLAAADVAWAQPGQPFNARVVPVGAPGDSTWVINLPNGDVLHVITTAAMQAASIAFSERVALREKVAVYPPLIAAHERALDACTNARTLDAQFMQLQKEQIADYDTLATELKRLANPWVSWEAGIGRMRGDVAAVAGIGVKRVRGWLAVADDRRPSWFLGYSGSVF